MSHKPETLKFEAQTKQLLDLMIHSLYSNKEIFLRELVSNASDALDKLRFEVLTKSELANGGDPEIRIDADSAARTLTIKDNGIGMSRQELISNIGTIAKSGTKELTAKLKNATKSHDEAATLEMIGEFGVGFYSCFMVADTVSIVTRRAGEDTATGWESKGDGTYTISDSTRDEFGTTITLHLKDVDEDDGINDFTKEWVIRDIVKKYSDFVRYPIVMAVTREQEEEGEKIVSVNDEVLNSQKAIWLRPEKEVKDEEFAEYYKQLAHDWTDPLTHIAMKIEGRYEYHSLLFIPSRAPMDLFYKDHQKGLQLYVKNVKILDKCEDLLPDFLRFVKGVVDSSDLPLNVSRELLQSSRQITQIKTSIVRKVLSELTDLKENSNEKYLEFWTAFGAVLKEGVSATAENKDKIVPLIMFASSNDSETLTDLAGYVERMKEGQEEIFYLSGESREKIMGSPHLEAFASKGYEVLFLTDAVDEFMTGVLTEFDGKKLVSVSKGNVELGSDEEKEKAKKDLEEKSEQYGGFVEALKKQLEGSVDEVRLSNRMTSSAACLVGGEHDLSPHIERMLRQNQVDVPTKLRTLEINPGHEIIAKLKARFDVRPDDELLGDHAKLLLGQALLAEGSPLPEPAEFAALTAKLLQRSL